MERVTYFMRESLDHLLNNLLIQLKNLFIHEFKHHYTVCCSETISG